MEDYAQMLPGSPQIVYNIISGDAYFYGQHAPQTMHRTTPASTPHSQGQSFSSRATSNTGDQPDQPMHDQVEEQKHIERTTHHVDPATTPSSSSGIDAHRNPGTDTTPSSLSVRTESTGNSASTRPSISHATTQTSETLESKGRVDNTADTAHSTLPVGFSRPFPYMIAPPSEPIDHDRKLVPGPASRLSPRPSPSDDNTACVQVRNEDEVDIAGEENRDRRRRTRSLWKRALSKLGALLR